MLSADTTARERSSSLQPVSATYSLPDEASNRARARTMERKRSLTDIRRRFESPSQRADIPVPPRRLTTRRRSSLLSDHRSSLLSDHRSSLLSDHRSSIFSDRAKSWEKVDVSSESLALPNITRSQSSQSHINIHVILADTGRTVINFGEPDKIVIDRYKNYVRDANSDGALNDKPNEIDLPGTMLTPTTSKLSRIKSETQLVNLEYSDPFHTNDIRRSLGNVGDMI